MASSVAEQDISIHPEPTQVGAGTIDKLHEVTPEHEEDIERAEVMSEDNLLLEDDAMNSVMFDVMPKVKGMAFACIGLQVSFVAWSYTQEKLMTTEYSTGKFPSTTFAVFANRMLAIIVAPLLSYLKNGTVTPSAPKWSFAPCALSNSLSSYAQYEVLHHISFPLQTLAKSTKVIPVMLMGIVINKESYDFVDYLGALAISGGVLMVKFSEDHASDRTTQLVGVALLVLYVASDSFTSQWQARVYKTYPSVDQFRMMFLVNVWSMLFTIMALVTEGKLLEIADFLQLNAGACIDILVTAVTSCTGQLFIYYTIWKFGPFIFTVFMTLRRLISILVSAWMFDHDLGFKGFGGTGLVFSVVFAQIIREEKRRKMKASAEKATADCLKK